MMVRFVSLVMMGVVLSSCASMRDSLLIGVGSGAVSGAVVGAASTKDTKGKSAFAGAAVGALVGGVATYFVHKGLDKRDNSTRKETLFGLEKFGVTGVPRGMSSTPSVSFRVIEEQTIETHRQGNKVIEGHRIWVLSDDSGVFLSPSSGSSKERR